MQRCAWGTPARDPAASTPRAPARARVPQSNRGLADVCSRPIPKDVPGPDRLPTSSSSRPSSSCPSSFHPSSVPWSNHLLDVNEPDAADPIDPPGHSRRPHSARPTGRRDGAPELSMTPCTAVKQHACRDRNIFRIRRRIKLPE
jgi:hypothetical protein